MKLSGALSDDLAALEASTFCVLPYVDLSGRQLLFSIPHSRAGKGITAERLVSVALNNRFFVSHDVSSHMALQFLQLRIFWYAAEVISQDSTDVVSGYVHTVWMKDASVWDFDIPAYKRLSYFEKSCWPVKAAVVHACCPTALSMKILKPIMFAAMTKGTRSRTQLHYVQESEIVEVLSRYGILKDMLPTEMGGPIQISQSEWLANRRAAELEEL